MKKLILLTLACVLFAGSVQAAPAVQSDSPTITSFTTPLAAVDRTALKNRRVRVPVSWQTANRPIITNLFFEQVFADGSFINVELPRLFPWVSSSGDGIAAPIEPPGTTSEIVLRVRLINLLTQEVYSEKQITLPISNTGDPGSDVGFVPTVTRFSANPATVLRSQLQNGTARIPVQWMTKARPLTANLVFEQVVGPGHIVNVELPRAIPWVNSAGSGLVAPLIPDSGDQIQLRLRLIDLVNGRIYDQRFAFVTVVDAANPAISAFSTSATEVNAVQLQQGSTRVPVTWAVQNRPANSNLQFNQVMPDGRLFNIELPRSFPIIPSSGVGVVAPLWPGAGATSIKIQVRLIDMSSGSEYTHKEISLPIVSNTGAPKIDLFSTSATSVTAQSLKDRTARIPVTWQVSRRPSNSNLVFEQRLPNGQVINVELPRPNPIVPSAGTGLAAPTWPGSGQTSITLLLRVFDLTSGATLTSAEISVPISDSGSQGGYETGAVCLQTPYAASNGTTIGKVGRVLDGISITSLPVRNQPFGDVIASLPVGALFDVIGGPACWQIATFAPADQYEFRAWKIRARSSSLEGWIEEYGRRSAGSPFYYFALIEDADQNQPGVISSFNADPMTVAQGGTLTLSWNVANASSVQIQAVRPDDQFGQTWTDLPLVGTLNYTLPEENTQFARFQLSVQDAEGHQTDVETLTVIVTCAFSNTYDGCPMSQATTPAAYQTFERGLMVWRGDTRQIFVLYGNGTYMVYPDTWTADQPVDSGETPPGGLILPAHGFGKVWAEQPGVRDGLGWATSQESSYTAKVEVYFVPGDNNATYLNTPDGRTLIIGRSWQAR